jgi:hypothetical protein
VGDAKERQMAEFTVEQNDKTPLTSYFGAKIAVSHNRSDIPQQTTLPLPLPLLLLYSTS